MVAFLIAVAAMSQAAAASPTPARLGRTAWVFATIGHSEWCPPGKVRLDLRTGQYAVTPRAARNICNDPDLERPIKTGKLAAGSLAEIRAAFLRVLDHGGVRKPRCRNGALLNETRVGEGSPATPNEVIVSNGGVPIMVLMTGAETGAAPQDLNCWSDGARELHGQLKDAFISFQQ